MLNFEVIVVGGGHAGIEAASSCSKMGIKTLLITHNSEKIGELSCNPSVGGIGKSQLVREVDAMGGEMGVIADISAIQVRVLNKKKGAAVWSTRAQVDRQTYKETARNMLEHLENLKIFQDSVVDLIFENKTVIGIKTKYGANIYANAIILANGTFLNGQIYTGEINFSAGRFGCPASTLLSNSLRKLDLTFGRLKTGTPARLDKRTIDFSKLEKQIGDKYRSKFSFISNQLNNNNYPCYIARTNKKTHDLIYANIDKSPAYSKKIEGNGPRYCPSIEDKIIRFSEKQSHQIFIEPEGVKTNEMYPNGISTGLPCEIQEKFIRSISGLENVHITRFGYSIEYDFFDPRQLYKTLESKIYKNLFFAGQINGTTGYEEAAAQGLVAGINASLIVKGKEPWIPLRSESYIGVLIDDLTSKGISEPYRMFTSRAEYRLLLREDNADLRLTKTARGFGLINNERWEIHKKKIESIINEKERLKNIFIKLNSAEEKNMLKFFNKKLIKNENLLSIMKKYYFSYYEIKLLFNENFFIPNKEIAEQVEIDCRYFSYIKRQQKEIEKLTQFYETKIPYNINYKKIIGLSNEVRQKLIIFRPKLIRDAVMISGITPAAISILMFNIKNKKHELI